MPIMVQISELDVTTPEGRPLFRDLHFRLHRGEWACVVGPPGSGKTTLLKLLWGELRPDHGQILVDDRNVIRLSPARLRELRRRLGIVTAGWELRALARRPPLECVAFKLRALELARDGEEARARAREALQLVGLRDGDGQGRRVRVEHLEPLDRRRLQLALALSTDPVLLLLDDPLRDLDRGDRERFLGVLREIHLRRRLSVLMTLTAPAVTAKATATAGAADVSWYALEKGRLKRLPSAPAPATARGEGGEP